MNISNFIFIPCKLFEWLWRRTSNITFFKILKFNILYFKNGKKSKHCVYYNTLYFKHKERIKNYIHLLLYPSHFTYLLKSTEIIKYRNGRIEMSWTIDSRVLTVKIIIWYRKKIVIDTPRIQLNTSFNHSHLPFVLHRRQFPLRITCALTINQSQGQTFEWTGIYIQRPIFVHG